MVSRDYLTARPARPSRAKVYFDQQVIPAGINMAGAVEGVALRMSQAATRSPVAAVLLAVLVGAALSAIVAASLPKPAPLRRLVRRLPPRVPWR